MVGIPQGGENVGSAWPHVYSDRGRLTQLVIRHGRNRQNMPPGRDAVVVPATLDNVRNGLVIDLKVGGKVPAEVRHSDHNETATWLSRGVGCLDCRE